MSKPNLILLHGALGAHDQFGPLSQALTDDFEIHSFSFSGHGARPLDGKAFRMATFVQDLHAYLQEHSINAANVFGYSMGGYAATELALVHPELFSGIMTLGSKFEWSPEIAAREARGLNPAKIAEKVPAFAAMLAKRHSAMGWENLLMATADMMQDLGAADNRMTPERVAELTTRMRFARGDGDRMVSLEETVNMFKAVPGAELEIMPGTPHPLEQVNIQGLSNSIRDFFLTS